MVFHQKFVPFQYDISQIHYVVELLPGRALEWAEVLFSKLDLTAIEQFIENFKNAFILSSS